MSDDRVDSALPGQASARAFENSSAPSNVPAAAPFERLKRPALWLVLALLAATLLFWRLGIQTRWEPPYLQLALQIAVVGVTSFVVAALALRSFLRSGNWPVLWLGAATLTYGLAISLTNSLLQWANVNAAVAIYSLTALLTATLHLVGAFFLANGITRRDGPVERRITALQVSLFSLLVVILITVAALRGFLPPFFVQGQGGTPWRQIVVVMAGLAFLLAGLSYFTQYRRNKADFLYWYALGLLLNALVMGGTLLTVATGTPLSWLVRVTLALSGLYLLVAVLVTRAEARARKLSPSEVLASFFGQDEANLKLLFENIMDAIIVTDRRFVITMWNQAAEEVYGWKAEEVVGKPVGDILHTAYLSDSERQRAQDSPLNAGPWKGEVWQRHRDGRQIVVLATVSALKDSAGRLVGTVAVNRDIMERAQLEGQLRQANAQLLAQAGELRAAAETLEQRVQERTAELAESEERYRLLCENSADAIFLTATDGSIQFANPAACHMLGLTEEQIEALGRHGLADPTDIRWAAAVELRELTGCFSGELSHLRGDGSTFPGEVTSNVFQDKDGHRRTTTIVRDISERKRMEEELRIKREQLAQREAALQNLTHRLVELQEQERYSVAKQLYDDEGQRLAGLLLNLGNLQRNAQCPPPIASQLGELTELVDGVLRDMHDLAVSLRPVSLDRLGLGPALNQLASDFGQQYGLKVIVELRALDDRRLPNETATNLYRVVQEAFMNAARHGHADCVSVTATCHDGRLTIIVEDDGVGFDVFEAELRGSLGLLGMHERTEAVGGNLTIESAPNHGTSVFVAVPC